ncbi:DUF2851 family protein [Marinilabiliaceae bacterium JC017]|nr:DUF2851 family protein [Marinilabiliaceae bacterium JC017]
MTEDFLQYLWQQRLCHQAGLRTVAGEPLEIIHPGMRNSDAGPDFFNAKVKIGNTMWAGNIEVHVRADDWYQHGHHLDPAYNNVILHIVKELGNLPQTSLGGTVPVWQMTFDPTFVDNYNNLQQQGKWIPCEDKFTRINSFIMTAWLESLLIERLEEKEALLDRLWERYHQDQDEVFYVVLARSMGFGVNGDPFEYLARQTPLKILLKHADNIFQVEALLLGQAGFLTHIRHPDSYSEKLAKEYAFLAAKYKLKPLDVHVWKFLRLRPSNFPTIRIAQLAMIIHQSRGVFDQVFYQYQVRQVEKCLGVTAVDYWDNHYRLGVESERIVEKSIGRSSVHLIMVNSLIPFLFLLARKKVDEAGVEKALKMLEELPAEQNSILTNWERLGIVARDAAQAQALIFLKKAYCNPKKCLYCRVGHHVISSS